MSIFAGVYARRAGQSIPTELSAQLRAAVSRHPDDKERLQQVADGPLLLFTLDVGALGGTGRHADSESFAFVAGVPLLQAGTAPDPQPFGRARISLAV